jgi:hypothetical protein
MEQQRVQESKLSNSTREQTVQVSESKIFKEAKERFEKFTGDSPIPDMDPIPCDIFGLAYTWYPIMIVGKNKEDLKLFMEQATLTIHPCINTFRVLI